MKIRFHPSRFVCCSLLTGGIFVSSVEAQEAALETPDHFPAAAEQPLAANDTEGILAKVGSSATVRGEVGRVGVGPSGVIHFVNFVGTNRDGFVAIVRKEAISAFHEGFGPDFPFNLSGKVVEITGTVDLYQDDPQIVLVTPDQLRVVE